ncbi:MAG: flagellar brake protein [Solirubrobacteraceae bacterium]
MRLRRAKNEASKPVELPGRAETVTISTAAGGRIPARVIERGPNTLLLAILVPTKPFSASDLDGLVLEYPGPRGRVRLRGTAMMEDPKEPDLLRIEAPRSIEVLQEREYVRIQSARPVVVYAGGDRQEVQSYTVDLSGGGFLLAGPDTLKVGEEVKFQLTITQGVLPITGKGKVVRIDSRGRLAVSFQDISDLDRRRLVRFIFECQRSERRRGLQTEERNGN